MKTIKKLSLTKEIQLLTSLSYLLSADISLSQALMLLEKQGKISNISECISKGEFLSAVLRRSNLLSSYAIAMIEMGEQSGNLRDNIASAALEQTKRKELQGKLIGACVYPICVLGATLGLSLLIVLYVLPKIVPIFLSLNIPLPISTRILMTLAEIIKNYWWLLLFIGVGGTIVSIYYFKRLISLRILAQKMLIKIPFVGDLLQTYYEAHVWRNASTMLGSGVAFSEAVRSSFASSWTLHASREQEISSEIKTGTHLSVTLQNCAGVSEQTSDLLSLAEVSGTLQETMRHLAVMYEKQFDARMKALTSMLEPILMIVMGIVVGIIAISVVGPIYEITSNIKK